MQSYSNAPQGQEMHPHGSTALAKSRLRKHTCMAIYVGDLGNT